MYLQILLKGKHCSELNHFIQADTAQRDLQDAGDFSTQTSNLKEHEAVKVLRFLEKSRVRYDFHYPVELFQHPDELIQHPDELFQHPDENT